MTEQAKAEEIPTRPNWYLSINNERGTDKFEAFDFIKITLNSGDYIIPVTSVIVPRIDGLVCESHSIVSVLIRQNLEAQAERIRQLEAENEALKSRIEKLSNLLYTVDNFLCERIIDPCGYDPEKESKEDLILTVTTNSVDNETLLNKLRAALKADEGEE